MNSGGLPRQEHGGPQRGRRAGVVGGRGFLGARIAQGLRDDGWLVEVFSLEQPLLLDGGVVTPEAHDLDLVIWAATRNTPAIAAERPELIQQEIDEVAASLRALSVAAPRAQVVFLSSGGTVYGGGSTSHREGDELLPESAYGRLKVELEKVVLTLCARAAILRVANAYGPGQGAQNAQGVLGYWLHAIRAGEPITVYGNPASARDYIYIDDITSAVVAVARRDTAAAPQRIYNVGSGVATSLEELLTLVKQVVRVPIDIVYQAGRGFDLSSSKLDSSLIERELGWRAQTPLHVGVARMWEWTNI